MKRPRASRTLWLCIAAALSGPALVSCSKSSTSTETATENPPPAPAMPPGWAVKTDDVISSAQFAAIQPKLKGKLKALRNTVYDANGHRIQLNVIVAASAMDADLIERSLGEMKAKWAVRRKGDVLYEFVGNDDASDEIRKASANLEP